MTKPGNRLTIACMHTNGGQLFQPIALGSTVRYIKLGLGDLWAKDCLQNGVIQLGFRSGSSERFEICRNGNWSALREFFLAEDRTAGTATRFTNEVKTFFEDDGSILWITFVEEVMWWGILINEPAEQLGDNDSVVRRVDGGWKCHDLKAGRLTKSIVSGALTKFAAYRGTSCNIEEDIAAYAIRRINGETLAETENATRLQDELKRSVIKLIRNLHETDFEILVGLVFSTSGWQRQGTVGGQQKTIDIDVILPTTLERAFVQVKSSTDQKELDGYINKLDDSSPFDRMFYVYHSVRGGELIDQQDKRVFLIGPEKLAGLVVDQGLTNWLIRKAT